MRSLPFAATAVLAAALAVSPDAWAESAAARSLPTRPADAWTPPPEAVSPPSRPVPLPEVPPELLNGTRTISLAEAVDVALSTSPVTRRSWAQARSAAAEVGSRQAAFWPQVDLSVGALRQQQVSLGGSSESLLTTWGPAATLTWTLLDFGGRGADVEEKRQALFSAGFLHNAAVTDVVLAVQTSYYQYQGAKALLAATESSLKQAEENLTAAEERRRAGVATVADVLQAKTSLSQRRLEVETARGLIDVTRGALATSLGVPANLPVDVTDLPDGLRLEGATPTVEELIAEAERRRPDLAAARARAMAARSKIASVRSSALPSLVGAGGLSRVYYESAAVAAPFGDNWSTGLAVRWPVFNGFQKVYDRKRAEEDAAVANASTDFLTQQAIYQVWSGYSAVKTAAERIRAAKDLLASAAESEQVTLGRYKAGVGGILDLLAAESSLASARATDVQARASFLVALAQLAHDTGALGLAPIPQLKKDTP
jgi:outer membrane protein TolC